MAQLNVRLLGAFAIGLDGQQVDGFESQKVRALLAYLAAERERPHCRDVLAGLLWPDEPERVARDNFRQALTNLRHAIGDRAAQPPFLLIVHDTIQLNPACEISVDASEFAALLAACAVHRHRHPVACGSCAERRARAADLYRGEFLAEMFVRSGPFEEWALLTRERLHAQALDALHQLAAYHERCAEYEEAIRCARRQLELEPWCEEAHQQVMRSLALSGQRSAALAQYQRCRRALAEELGTEPAAETTALHREISMGRLARADGAQEARVRGTRLPVLATPLIGRERECGELGALLEDPDCRLLTILGPGGIGKTHLALEVAAYQARVFADGVYFVPLAGLADPRFLAPAIASVLEITLAGPDDPAEQLVRHLRDRQLLLILDNFEHLLPGPNQRGTGTDLIASIARASRGIAMLVTSIQRLNLQAEWVFPLGGLSYPATMDCPVQERELYPALALFTEAARRAGARLDGSEEEWAAVIRLCRTVEGTPLAIQMAATWAGALPVTALADGIEQGVEALPGPLQDLPARHRSLQAVFDYSWDLLGSTEHVVLARASVFEGGFDAEAAMAVAGAGLPVLAALVDKSELRLEGRGRWTMHQLVRRYAAARLDAIGQVESAHAAHLAHCAHLAELASPQLKGPEQRVWQDRLEWERDNLRAALRWALESGQIEAAARLCCALSYFWILGGHYSEGRAWLARVLQAAADDRLPESLHAEILNVAGMLAQFQGDLRDAAAAGEQSLALFRRLGDADGAATALGVLGLVHLYTGELGKARQCLEGALVICRERGHPWLLAWGAQFLGSVASQQEDYASAEAVLKEGLVLARRVGDPQIIMALLRELGQLDLALGNYAHGQASLAEGLAIARGLSRKHEIGWMLAASGWGRLAVSEYGLAARAFLESLAACDELGDKWYVALNLLGLAGVCSRCRLYAEGARLYGASEALSKSIGVSATPLLRKLRAWVMLGMGRRILNLTCIQARAEGRALPLDEAVAQALALQGRLSDQPSV